MIAEPDAFKAGFPGRSHVVFQRSFGVAAVNRVDVVVYQLRVFRPLLDGAYQTRVCTYQLRASYPSLDEVMS